MDTKKELEAIYVEMPVSITQKKEYNRLGYRVVDAQFAPEGYEPPDLVLVGVGADIPHGDDLMPNPNEHEPKQKRTSRSRSEPEE